MLVGKVFGKLTPSRFKFLVEGDAKQFDYVQVYHKEYEYVLSQIVELVRDEEQTVAHCTVIGYKNDQGQIKSIRSPFEPGSEVLRAEDDFIKSIIKLDSLQSGAFIGRLEGRNIDVHLDLRELLTKHVAVLAKSGAGKSYTVGVLLEEIMEQKVPLLIIDPHGEYVSLKKKNDDKFDVERLARYGMEAKGYKDIVEYGDQTVNADAQPLLITENLTATELIHMLPGKVSSTQLGILHTALRDRKRADFDMVLASLDTEENNAKWTLISHIEHLQRLGIFSTAPVDHTSMIVPGKATIINLRGIAPDVQELVVYKLMKDLFELRKKDKVPPFFTVIEEAHNYCPERSFGETKCSKVLRNVASEGRKFGLGLCIVSQRPARVDKSVLSQCTTQIILKVTNPNDLRAVVNSVEGISSESEREIQNLAIGTALVTGVVDVPLFTEIRPRRSQHGGNATEMIDNSNLIEKLDEFEDMLPVIKPKITPKDIEVMSDKSVERIDTVLIPAVKLACRNGQRTFSIVVELVEGGLLTSIEKRNVKRKFLPPLFKLSKDELTLLEKAVRLRRFTKEDLLSITGPNKHLESALSQLADKEFIIRKNGSYELNDRFVFSSLEKLHFPYTVEYLQTPYTKKLEPAMDKKKLVQELAKFTEVTDEQDCWIVHYEIVT